MFGMSEVKCSKGAVLFVSACNAMRVGVLRGNITFNIPLGDYQR